MKAPAFKGVHTALVTPFTAAGALDLDAARALAERQVAAGVDGLVPCGTTGETPTLDHDEWAQVIRVAVEAAKGKALVTAGCGTNNTRSTVRNIEEAAALGADAALVVLPYYNKPNPDGHRAHLRAACDVGLPVVLYNIPGRTAQTLSKDLLFELAAMDGVVAVKEATGDIGLGSDLVSAVHAAVLSGDDFTWFPLSCVGGKGVISVVSNVDPWHAVALAEAVDAGDLPLARGLHHQMIPLVRYLFSSSNPAPCKAALAALGLCTDQTRLPLAPVAGPPAALLSGVRR